MIEICDLENDPQELNNIAPDNPGLIKAFEDEVIQLLKAEGGSFIKLRFN